MIGVNPLNSVVASRGRLVESHPTPFPNAFIHRYEAKPQYQLKIRIEDPTRYVFRSLETTDLQEAMAKFPSVYTGVIQDPDELSRTHIIQINKLVDLFVEDQMQRVARGEITKGTYEGKERTIYKGLVPFCRNRQLVRVKDVNHLSFRDYPTWRRDNYGYEQSTINTEIRHLKEFLYWCQKLRGLWGGFEWMVPPLRKVKGGPKPNSAYTDEMVEEMSEYLIEKSQDKDLSPHQRFLWKLFIQFFTLSLDSGTRTSEWTWVQWKHVKLQGFNKEDPSSLMNVVVSSHIPVSKTGPRDIIFQSPVLINLQELYKSKKLILTPDDYVFTNILNRTRLGPQGFNAKWKEMAGDLGYGPEFTLYSTRSTYISDRIVQGTPLSMIAQNCGNSSRMIEERYRDIILQLNKNPLVQRRISEDDDGEFKNALS